MGLWGIVLAAFSELDGELSEQQTRNFAWSATRARRFNRLLNTDALITEGRRFKSALASKISFLSATSAKPATIQICSFRSWD
jgi:hypothetical protein